MHSGHVEFFRQASQYGDLYVGIGSDKTILHYKNHKTVYSEQERLFMVKSIRYVKEAYINAGDGILDFLPTLDIVKPDILVVNSDGGSDAKRKVCEERGVVSGLDASRYLKNHRGRYALSANITMQEARDNLSDRLTVEASETVLFEYKGREVLAYEFFCSFDGKLYFIYVDAMDGRELFIVDAKSDASLAF